LPFPDPALRQIAFVRLASGVDMQRSGQCVQAGRNGSPLGLPASPL